MSVSDLLRKMSEESVPEREGDRERAIARMSKTMRVLEREAEKRALRTRIFATLALVAAVFIGVFVGFSLRKREPVAAIEPTIRIVAITGSITAANRDTLAPNDRLSTSDGSSARLVFPTGASVDIDGSSRVGARIAGGERTFLDLGAVDVHVPKLGPTDSFTVETPDALVTVHGTTFRVEYKGETRVHVTEGRVSVRHGSEEIFLGPGDSYPSEHASVMPIETSAPEVESAPKPSIKAPAPSAKPATTSLADQNRLLQAALSSKRAGRDADALSALDELLAKYPASSHAQDAHVERFRILERMKRHDEAVTEARLYLAMYPGGFARTEALEITNRP